MDTELKLELKEEKNEVKVDVKPFEESKQIEEKICETTGQKPQVNVEEPLINETVAELEPKVLQSLKEDTTTTCTNVLEVEVQSENEIETKNFTDIIVAMDKPEEYTLKSHMPQSISLPATPTVSGRTLKPNVNEVKQQQDETLLHLECMAQQEQQRVNFEQQSEQLRAALTQKENMIALFQRENTILEKEKQAFRKEKEMANKEKESIVIKFAMKEKLLIDAKKEKDVVEKQLAEAKKEIKNVSTRFQAIHEEKSRITYMMDEKCNEVRKYQRECEKLKTDYNHLESKLKYHINKLNMETEAKQALERKLEEERNSPNKLEEKANEKLKVEYDANAILLKHEITGKDKIIETLNKEQVKAVERIKLLQEQLSKETTENTQLVKNLETLQQEHEKIQNAYSDEMLNSAKLRGQLDELQLLKTQNTLNEEKISTLTKVTKDLDEKLYDNAQDLQQLHAREQELLSFNKEMSESIVGFQSQICLLKSKAQGIEAENELLKKEKLDFDKKYADLEAQLKNELEQKSEERQLLTRHLCEKTKLYETTKMKLENTLGDLDATKKKQSQIVKELQREIQKYKKNLEQCSTLSQAQTTAVVTSPAKAFADSVRKVYCSQCQKALNGAQTRATSEHSDASLDGSTTVRQLSRNGSHSGQSSRRASNSSELEAVTSNALANETQGPSKKHLVERILRLQQASARQTEKIDFLENHTLSLVAELQKKSKVVQYYMLRDQAGALTSSKSDQNKSELAKYGGGVMSAIYGGIKGGANQTSMTLDLSLEINKKLQAVLEDTLLKNITLKENLDVLGLEVDKLTRKLAQLHAKE